MAAIDVNRGRYVVHDLTGIAAVGLDQEGHLMLAALLANGIIEDPLTPVSDKVLLVVAGQWLGKRPSPSRCW